jgi:hypothetical protein
MKTFNCEIKWPPFKSPNLLLITILIIISYFSITVNGECIDRLLQPGDSKTFVAKSQTCLRLICNQSNVIWKKNQDLIIGMFHSMLYMKEYSLV